MADDVYHSDPKAKTIAAMVEACAIFARHHPKGEAARFSSHASHDVFYGPCDADEIPEDSEDGRRLSALGWHVEEGDVWACFA